jgi:hypothetical protein
MPFEVQPERATVGKGGDLPLEISRERRLSVPQLAQQFVQS